MTETEQKPSPRPAPRARTCRHCGREFPSAHKLTEHHNKVHPERAR